MLSQCVRTSSLLSKSVLRGSSALHRNWDNTKHLPAFHIRQSSSSCSEKGVYELRTYSIVPGKLGELSELTRNQFHLRTSHSKLVGFWTSEIGGLNQVVHCWYYENLKERARVRAALAADKNWLSVFVSKAAPTWQFQENSLMVPLDGVKVNDPGNQKGVYELQVISLDGPISRHAGEVGSYLSMDTGKSVLVGAWRTVIGPQETVVALHQHADVDDIVTINVKESKEKDSLMKVSREWRSKLLLPHVVSPLS